MTPDKPRPRPRPRSRPRSRSTQTATSTSTTTSRVSKKSRGKNKTKRPQQQQQQEHNANTAADPDLAQTQRLEKLLGLNRKRKRKSSASYSDIFDDGDDELVDLLEFCDSRLQKKLKKQQSVVQKQLDSRTEKAKPGSTSSRFNEDQSPIVRESQEESEDSDGDDDEEDGDDSNSDGDDDDDETDDIINNDDIMDPNTLGSAKTYDESNHHIQSDSESEQESDEDEDVNNADSDDRHNSDVNVQFSAISSPDRDVKGEGRGNHEITENSPSVSSKQGNGISGLSSERRAATSASKRDSSGGGIPRRYVPPGARRSGGGKASTEGVKRRLRGLLNRVADANCEGIADNVAEMFNGQHGLSRRELADIYAAAAVEASRDGSGIGQMNPYVRSHAAIVAHLGHVVDGVVIASTLVVAVRRALATLQDDDLTKDGSDACGYVALICALFARGAVASQIVCQLLTIAADNLTSAHVEVLLFALRDYGILLRSSDPVGLKRVFEIIHERALALQKDFINHNLGSNERNGAKKTGTEEDDEIEKEGEDANIHHGHDVSLIKIQVLVDLVNDVKNNKAKRTRKRNDMDTFQWAQKPDTPLSADVNDLLDDDFVALRWWDDTKGLTISERRGNRNIEQTKGDSKEDSGNDDDDAEEENHNDIAREVNDGPDLSSLAVSLRLNTEFRRTLFRAIMGAASVTDAVERIQGLRGLDGKNGRDRDTALVILHCCAAERDFNPFYVALAEALCKSSRRMRFALEFALWDVFKLLQRPPGVPKRKRSLYAQFVASMCNAQALSVSVLRKMPADLDSCSLEQESRFYIDTALYMMRQLTSDRGSENDQEKLKAFENVMAETWDGVDDFRVALAAFIRRYVVTGLDKDDKDLPAKGLALKSADLLEKR